MLSIIICSRQSALPDYTSNNIRETIGCDYELIIVDNSSGDHNIFSAYNEGLKKTHGEFLCFMHEDVVFHSVNWGIKVESVFADHPETGMIGIVGGQFIPDTPCSYWEGGCSVGEMIQGSIGGDGKYQSVREGKKVMELTDVVAIDGFWMCLRRDLFSKVYRDDKTYDGFHCYDIDISMQVWESGYKVQIVPDILIEHKSLGNTDSVYLEQNQRFYEKWKDSLPVCRGLLLSEKEIEQRTAMVKYMRGYLDSFVKAERQLNSIRKSKAYRIGRAFLFPLRSLKPAKR